MGNAQANEQYTKEFLGPLVKDLRKFYDAADDWARRKTFSSWDVFLKSSADAKTALETLETYLAEPYDPN